MNSKALIISIGSAVLGLIFLLLYMKRFEAEASGGPAIPVLIAVQDVPLGTALTENMLGVRRVPQSYVEDRFIRYSDLRRILGVRVSMGLRANQAVLWTDLATASDARRDLSSLVRTGMRAITIRAGNVTNSFGGLLRPGDRVDVLGTLSRTGNENDRVTVPLIQNVLVLAAGRDTGGEAQRQTVSGQATSSGPTEISQVTLSVSMEEAQLLTFAADRGGAGGRHTGLSLVLRNPEDIAIMEGLPETNLDDIFEPTRRANASRRRRQEIEQIRSQNPQQ